MCHMTGYSNHDGQEEVIYTSIININILYKYIHILQNVPLITNQNIDHSYSFTHGWRSIHMIVSSFITLPTLYKVYFYY